MSKPALFRPVFAVLFESEHEPAARTHGDLVRGDARLERKGFALESEKIDAVGDDRSRLAHAQRLEIDLHLARLAVGVDAGDVPGAPGTARQHHVLARESVDELHVIPNYRHALQEIAHV